MTTVRRITVSQINGQDANNSDTNEIRPFGETGFYLDENTNPSKLVLMMFDGQRTNIKSKVLSPGVLYGSNADSGDGANLDTIKLIPDATLYYNGSEQYITIDPTAPNHIHIRAGGAIDSSSADLFLGGENNYFKVGAGSPGQVSIASNNYVWLFGSDGTLIFPTGSNLTFDSSANSKIDGVSTIQYADNTIQTTAWTGGHVVSAPESSTGAAGNKLGDIAFNSSYFYYCTADYTDGLTNIWKRVGWSGDTW